jgi:hypothetical protein
VKGSVEMKFGYEFSAVYVPRLGFVKVGSTIDETMENIKRAEVEKEIKEKKERKRFIENKDAPLDHL